MREAEEIIISVKEADLVCAVKQAGEYRLIVCGETGRRIQAYSVR